LAFTPYPPSIRVTPTPPAVAGTPLGLAIPAAIFTGIAAISVLAILFLPDGLINLPNREYWLATRERRIEAAMLMLNFWLWILAGGLGVAIGILQAMIQATFTGRDQIALPVVAGFVVFLIARIAVLIIRLRRGRDVEAVHPKRRA
jgi:hypothetical protein